ncbi:hypothetical protein H4R35_003491 [Dimargaris xerosporica]|nr:hypothetical protein H4R35_003491 [Dimargaris xerosporica]
MNALVVQDKWLTSVRQLLVTPNVPVPELKPGQVLVKVMAAGANFFDILMVQGQYQIKPPRPFTPGCEFAGFIIKTHAHVHHLAVMGATVIATVGSKEKMAVVEKAGADHVVNYCEADWPVQVHKLTPGGQGVNIVYDPVGLVEPSLKCTAWNGRVVVVGFAAGAIEKVAMNQILLKNVSLVGLHWGAYIKNQPKRVPEVWGALLPLLEQQQLVPQVYPHIFDGLGQVPDALEAIASQQSYGKVMVQVAKLNIAKL